MKRLSPLLLLLVGLVATSLRAQSIDYHVNGMWYQPELSGHGFNIVVQPAASIDGKTVFVTFFTYDDSGAANFYVGNVDVADWPLGEALTLPLQQSAGGGFSSPRQIDFSDPAQFAVVGDIALRLNDCTSGEVNYRLLERSGGAEVEQGFAIEKAIGVPPDVCQSALIRRGAIANTTEVAALGLSDYQYFLYVPQSYQPDVPLPLMIAWHGAAGPGQAQSQARVMRDLWAAVAEQNQFIVLAQTGTSPNGSWIPANAAEVLAQLLQELQADYSIDLQRIYGWGFSAGGHTMHSIALANTDLFASYAINAGVLNAVVGQSALTNVARALPVSSLIGSADSLLNEAQGDRDAFLNAGWRLDSDLFYREFSGGHTVTVDHLAEHWSNLSEKRLPQKAKVEAKIEAKIEAKVEAKIEAEVGAQSNGTKLGPLAR